MKFVCTPSSFEEVAFDWVAAELRSPTFAQRYRAVSPALVAKMLDGDPAGHRGLDPAQMTEMENGLRRARSRLLSVYPLDRRWRYQRATVTPSQLARFSTLWVFSPLATLGALAARLDADPTYRPVMRAAIERMQRSVAGGAALGGRPVAVLSSRTDTPVLIEGYKRSIVAMRSAMPAVEIYLCRPPQRVRLGSAIGRRT